MILLCKNYSINLTISVFITKSDGNIGEMAKKIEILENISLVFIDKNSQIFKNLDLLISSIDYLPKELSKLFKEIF